MIAENIPGGSAFEINVEYEGKNHQLQVKPKNYTDQVLYEIYDNGLLCVIGLTEEKKWEADRDIHMAFVEKIGDAIDKVESV